MLDLSGIAAGEPDVRIRFRYDSGGSNQGWVWQVDNVKLEQIGGAPTPDKPDPAHSPSPADGAGGVGIESDLGWTAGDGATSHDVYFGTASPPAFQGNQGTTVHDPGTLLNGTTYYWRIDEVNTNGTTTGTVWSFTTGGGGGGINLSANGYKVQGRQRADLTWSGASGGWQLPRSTLRTPGTVPIWSLSEEFSKV